MDKLLFNALIKVTGLSTRSWRFKKILHSPHENLQYPSSQRSDLSNLALLALPCLKWTAVLPVLA